MRVRRPPSHSCEQRPHLPHAVTSQWIGHTPASHIFVRDKAGHALPPKRAGFSQPKSLFCVRVPTPHEAEQLDHSPHSEAWQSIGHAVVLHAVNSLTDGHGFPPDAADRVIWRVRLESAAADNISE